MGKFDKFMLLQYFHHNDGFVIKLEIENGPGLFARKRKGKHLCI